MLGVVIFVLSVMRVVGGVLLCTHFFRRFIFKKLYRIVEEKGIRNTMRNIRKKEKQHVEAIIYIYYISFD